jgi:hypothetical protein
VAHGEEKGNAYRVLTGKPEKKKIDRWEDKLVYGKVMLKFIFKRGDGRAWSGFVLSQNRG